MPAPNGQEIPLARGSRVAPAISRSVRVRDEHAPPPRQRRGILNASACHWRRCEFGSNHIMNFGVWTLGRRRASTRVNRSGETRWHRPAFGTTKF